MTMTNQKTNITGRAATVLVFKQDGNDKAVVSAVVVKTRRKRGKKRLFFTGQASFDSNTVKHLDKNILPIVDNILQLLDPQCKQKAFEISIVNLGVASALDLGVTVSGFSADTAVLLAMLSAVLEIPLSQDVVTTGHIASGDGDIRPVRSIEAKIKAAIENQDIKTFIYPSFDPDISKRTLSSEQTADEMDIIPQARKYLQMIEVSDICQLAKSCFSCENVLLAALGGNFFEINGEPDNNGSNIEKVGYFLTHGNEKRFWQNVEVNALAGNCNKVRQLLQARVKYQIRCKQYPAEFGRKLLQLILSIPPSTRTTEDFFPLFEMKLYFEMCQFIQDEDCADAIRLMDAICGRLGPDYHAQSSAGQDMPVETDIDAAVKVVLVEIGAESLARKVGLPIDAARATYIMKEVTVDSNTAFLELVSAFYLALVRHTGLEPASVDERTIGAEALSMLDRAYKDKGGIDAAEAEGRNGFNGGMRFIFDIMTEQFKFEQQSKHINSVLKRTFNPLQWNDRVKFTRVFLEQIGPQMPADIRNMPAEKLANHFERIVQVYSKSLDNIKQLLRKI